MTAIFAFAHRFPQGEVPVRLSWSQDGAHLAVCRQTKVFVFDTAALAAMHSRQQQPGVADLPVREVDVGVPATCAAFSLPSTQGLSASGNTLVVGTPSNGAAVFERQDASSPYSQTHTLKVRAHRHWQSGRECGDGGRWEGEDREKGWENGEGVAKRKRGEGRGRDRKAGRKEWGETGRQQNQTKLLPTFPISRSLDLPRPPPPLVCLFVCFCLLFVCLFVFWVAAVRGRVPRAIPDPRP